eukprot:TRINITY_DN3233_c0_g1_i2.p1 TRINITY_DN3233_c0_g1~~TRINITY_DN3233_c0_g1_i2.p1  ORF type:complete len:672 (-),score=172.58 TRINITY_DN3233_c0_g1_i2:185-2200(-)
MANSREDLFLRSTLQLLECRAEVEYELHDMFRQLQDLIPEHNESTGLTPVQKSFLERLRKWIVSELNRKGTAEQMPDDHTSHVCGFLKKESHLRWDLRYVVLEDTSLFYYKDSKRADLRGMIDLTNALCTIDEKKPFSFIITKPEGVLNPLHPTRKQYRWSANNQDECDMWINAIQRMSQSSLAVSRPLELRSKIEETTSIDEYLKIIRGFSCQCEQLVIPLPWVHRHAELARASGPTYGRERSERSSFSGSSESGSLSPKKQKQLARLQALELHDAHVKKRHGRISRGVSITQVQKDFTRDSLTFNGKEYHHQRIESILGDLSEGIFKERQKLRSEKAMKSNKCVTDEADSIKFAREVLRNCTRTVSGGDGYDAINLIFKSPDLVIITPDSGQASPVHITVLNNAEQTMIRTQSSPSIISNKRQTKRSASTTALSPTRQASTKVKVDRLLGTDPVPKPLILTEKCDWQSNSISQCEVCGKKLGLLSSRHHCRCCGSLCCQKCSDRVVYDSMRAKFVRSCAPCFKKNCELDSCENSDGTWPVVSVETTTHYRIMSLETMSQVGSLSATFSRTMNMIGGSVTSEEGFIIIRPKVNQDKDKQQGDDIEEEEEEVVLIQHEYDNVNVNVDNEIKDSTQIIEENCDEMHEETDETDACNNQNDENAPIPEDKEEN